MGFELRETFASAWRGSSVYYIGRIHRSPGRSWNVNPAIVICFQMVFLEEVCNYCCNLKVRNLPSREELCCRRRLLGLESCTAGARSRRLASR